MTRQSIVDVLLNNINPDHSHWVIWLLKIIISNPHIVAGVLFIILSWYYFKPQKDAVKNLTKQPKPSSPQQLTQSMWAFKEIYDSELVYMKQLNQLLKYYVHPLEMLTIQGIKAYNEKSRRKFQQELDMYNKTSIWSKTKHLFSRKKLEPDLEVIDDINVEPIITFNRIKEYFGSISTIIGVSKVLLHKIDLITHTKRHRTMKEIIFRRPVYEYYKVDLLVDFLKHFIPAFKLYCGYTCTYNYARENIKQEKIKNKRFRDFLCSQSELIRIENDNSKESHSIESLMITPVQRICRYEILIKTLEKCIADEHQSKDARVQKTLENLRHVVGMMGDVVRYTNNKKGEMDNINKVKDIQNSIGVLDLVEPHRRFKKEEGPDKESSCKLPQSNKSANSWMFRLPWTSDKLPCRLFLLNDCLVVAKRNSVGEIIRIPLDVVASTAEATSPASPRGQEDVTLTPRSRRLSSVTSGNGSSFVILDKDNNECATIYCGTVKERDEWMEAITSV
ncbi:RacGEF [Acrasis kona]|uniref:RacGEF n=1 Tax=Acrasis kona TaxID=1008807 RepID=A0AAW2YYK9_9EUKA